ncbi:integrator complex subunit 3-like isoform X2 [Paramacrobiotus metropolitanus]|uniref:integrator complex subunit 3-like isoform X2 n=1 Tax=Paramacrobiotus metropolitanus TaxID=2943436 RepID=UPI0024463904|nr:integrator complex subunit 3-like isoform X2 [Paramacrobiotus metropolitanus]
MVNEISCFIPILQLSAPCLRTAAPTPRPHGERFCSFGLPETFPKILGMLTKLEDDFNKITSIQNGCSENEGRDKLVSYAQQGTDEYVKAMDGLLYGILTDPGLCEKYMGDATTLSLLNAEAFNPLTRSLSLLASEKYAKLSDTARKQSVWLMKTFAKKNIPGLDRIFIPWMRNLTVGDHWKNVSLIEGILETLVECRPILDNGAGVPILQMALLTFIQLIQYHHTSLQYSVIKDKEVDFCLDLLRNKFGECMAIGKDFIRILMQICKMPKMKEFWSDLVNDPKKIAPSVPNFTGVPYILQLKTSRWIYPHRITADLEAKIAFLLSKVRAPQVSRYADIFLKQYLSSAEGEALIPEIIRFVCRSIHPTNEILGSDVLQRWNFFLILICTCKTVAGLNQCLLALFYDWMLFDPQGENVSIMFIEPGILLLMNVLQKNIKVLQKPLMVTLVEYLCKIPFEFFPPISAKVRSSIVASFRYILEKRVVGSVAPIIDFAPEEQKILLRKTYPEIFGPGEAGSGVAVNGGPGNIKIDLDSLPSPASLLGSMPELKTDDDEPMDDWPEPVMQNKTPKAAAVAINHKPIARHHSISAASKVKRSQEPSLDECIGMLPETMQPFLCAMRDGPVEEKCQIMEEFVDDVINKGRNFDSEQYEAVSLLARSLVLVLKPYYDDFRLPQTINEETLDDSIQSPLFILYRRLWEEEDGSLPRKRVIDLLVAMYPLMPVLGYLIIYYLYYRKMSPSWTTTSDARDVMADYEEFCSEYLRRTKQEEICEANYTVCIAEDLEACGQQDHAMLTELVPFLYKENPRIAIDSALIMKTVIGYIDAFEVQRLACLVLKRELIMLSDKGCVDVIKDSLTWETIEQTFFWKLLLVHDLKIDNILKEIVAYIDFRHHPEATLQVMELLRNDHPREALVAEVFRRDPVEVESNPFITICLHWTKKNNAMFTTSLSSIITKAGATNKKRVVNKATVNVKPDLTIDQVLAHLDLLRLYMVSLDQKNDKRMRDFASGLYATLYNSNVLLSLRTIKAALASNLKEKFREVLQLVEDPEDDVKASPGKKGSTAKRGRTKAAAKNTVAKDSDSDRSDEEDDVAPVKSKKARNKSPPVED